MNQFLGDSIWSQNNNTPFTVSNLTQKEENAKSLLQQLAEGYNSPHVDKQGSLSRVV
jgi:hypothetical protein